MQGGIMNRIINSRDAAFKTAWIQLQEEIEYTNNAIDNAISKKQTYVYFGEGENRKILSSITVIVLRVLGYQVEVSHDDVPLLADIMPNGRTNWQKVSWNKKYNSLGIFSILRLAKMFLM